MMKFFITGGTGFIGRELTKEITGLGYPVHLLVRSAEKAVGLNTDLVSLFKGDITDAAAVERSMKGCTHVFHLAAYARPYARDPSLFDRINLEGTQHVLEAALKLGIKKMVFTSTAGTLAATGPNNDASEESPMPGKQNTGYARTKALAEKRCKEYVQKGLDVTIVSPTRVFGPGVISKSNAVTRIIWLYKKGRWRIIPGDGKAFGNYVYIADVVNGHLKAMQKGGKGEKYILGGNNVPFNGLFETIASVTGRKRILVRIPTPLLRMASFVFVALARLTKKPALISPGWIGQYLQHRRLSSDKAARELGYTITPLRKGIENTLKWLDENEFPDSD